jgi:hypothetical protein
MWKVQRTHLETVYSGTDDIFTVLLLNISLDDRSQMSQIQ